MTEPKTVWQGPEYVEPIRGQESSMFWDSQGSQKCKARSVTFWSCGKCGVGLKSRDHKGGVMTWPKECSHCHWLNYPGYD